jgi:hypothetical protein
MTRSLGMKVEDEWKVSNKREDISKEGLNISAVVRDK